MKFRLYHIALILTTASCNLVSFGPLDDPTADGAVNLPVLASAGADREILRGYRARLEGSGTSSPAGRLITVRWSQLLGESVHLSNEADLSPTFLAPLDEQELIFELEADDGVWVTTDQVTLRVRRQPREVAPRIAAGADRFLDAEESDPSDADLAFAPGDGVTTLWQRVEPTASPRRYSDGWPNELDAAVYRLTAVRDGLSSAPDFLLLYPYDSEDYGGKAPNASLVALDLVAPGQIFTLDASFTTDVNGDELTFRWEQTHGTPKLPTAPGTAAVSLVAPSLAQELVFRVFASDGTLESAPAQASVVVSPESSSPVVAPQQDSRTHPGNLFLLDADGIPTPTENSDVAFFWDQTFGEIVDLELDNSGRYATFVAPEQTGDLAFSVHAELPDQIVPVQSDPEVARVTVVELSDNLAPEIFLCHTTAVIDAQPSVVITAVVRDPEADGLSEPEWSATATSGAAVELHPRAADDIIETALCDLSSRGGQPGTSGAAIAFQADFPADPSLAWVTVRLDACDELSACGWTDLKLDLQ